MTDPNEVRDADAGDAGGVTGPGQPVPPGPAPARGRDWGTKIVLVVLAVVLLALAVLLAVTFVPRWWAHRVGDVGDGKFGSSVFAGLVCGFVFTAAPLLVLRRVVARHGGLTARVVWLLVAAVLAAPNLITLGIVVGTGNAAHDAERTLAVEAPGFRNATAVGAAAGLVFVLMLWMLIAGRHRRTRQLRERDAELEELRGRLGHQRERREQRRGAAADSRDGSRDDSAGSAPDGDA